MSSNIASLHKILKDETRRKIILLLQEKGSLSYVDLMKALGITNTGKMNYHLKVLGDLLSKKEDGQYALSEKGVLASRLLLEFPERSASQLGLSSKEPQVFWWGIIICVFTLIGLSILVRFIFSAFASGYTSDIASAVPFFFVAATFLAMGFYMIYSDLRKNPKPNHKQGGLTKRKVVFLIFLILLGITFILLARSAVASDRQLTQIGYESNTSSLKSYTIFLQQGTVCQIDLAVSASEIGQTYNIAVRQVEENRSLFSEAGSIEGQIVRTGFPADSTGHYEIDWNNLDVIQLTAYRVDTVTPLISKSILSGAGVFTFIAAVLSFLGFKHSVFYSRKTGIFWWGLVVFGIALSWLFVRLWWGLVIAFYNFPFSLGPLSDVAEILASFVFLFIGFQMMKRGTTIESQVYRLATESRMRKLGFYLSQRNYRALVYLLVSIIINVWAVAQPYSVPYYFSYFNYVGFLLLLLFFGRPSMYGGWYDPTSIIPYILWVFGLFVEIFVVCEFLIHVQELAPRIKKTKPSNSAT